MVVFSKWLCLFSTIFMATICSTDAYFDIDIGGRKGWTVNPTEDHDIWAARMRFNINDTLHFIYNKGTDSVLVVSRDDYDKCNSKKPITKLKGRDGDSRFTLDRSGIFYFITGNKSNCDEGLKMHLIVLTIRNINSKTPPQPQPPSSPPTIVSPVTGVAGVSPTNVTAPPPLAQASAGGAATTVSFLMMVISLSLFIQLK